MKKLLSLILTAVFALSVTACGQTEPGPTVTPTPERLTKEETVITGMWNAIAVMAEGQVSELPTAYCIMEILDDKTAVSSIMNEDGSAENIKMTWEFAEGDGEMYVYKFINEQNATLSAAYSVADDSLILVAGDENGIMFEKVEIGQ